MFGMLCGMNLANNRYNSFSIYYNMDDDNLPKQSKSIFHKCYQNVTSFNLQRMLTQFVAITSINT